ncbi:uncharacterized protein LOC125674069 [Ostrea edulis]|uniref:uncharacterized protein LOC125674069 n=1 Tax=Ostrea edulis TaxID=37623 RepID=UPI0024AF9C0C|nr:uncharacterized protein LOC125674069 [Ostrea edulis]
MTACPRTMAGHQENMKVGFSLFLVGCIVLEVTGLFTHEDIISSEPACYGSTYESFLEVSCSADSYLFPLAVHVGAKPLSLGCKPYENNYNDNDTILYEACCKTINTSTDCVSVFDNPNITTYMTKCIGVNACRDLPIIWKTTNTMGCNITGNVTYQDQSSIIYMEHYCIERKRITTPVKDLTFRSNPPHDILYLTACDSNSYGNGIVERNVTCDVVTSNQSHIEVWIMDLRFNEAFSQLIEIKSGNSKQRLTTANNFDPRRLHFNTSNISVKFETTSNDLEYVWLGFKATPPDFIEIICEKSDRFNIAADTPSLSDEKEEIGMITGLAAGGLGILAICILISRIVYRRHQLRKIAEEEKRLQENEVQN